MQFSGVVAPGQCESLHQSRSIVGASESSIMFGTSHFVLYREIFFSSEVKVPV